MFSTFTPKSNIRVNDVDSIAKAHCFSEKAVLEAMMDGRHSSLIGELALEDFSWHIDGARYRFRKHPNRNNKGYDGYMVSSSGSKIKTGVRQLTPASGVSLKLSINTGGHRSCNQKQLEEAASYSLLTVVIDICDPYLWKYFLIDNRHLLEEIKSGKLSMGGWNKKQFYNFLKRKGWRGFRKDS